VTSAGRRNRPSGADRDPCWRLPSLSFAVWARGHVENVCFVRSLPTLETSVGRLLPEDVVDAGDRNHWGLRGPQARCRILSGSSPRTAIHVIPIARRSWNVSHRRVGPRAKSGRLIRPIECWRRGGQKSLVIVRTERSSHWAVTADCAGSLSKRFGCSGLKRLPAVGASQQPVEIQSASSQSLGAPRWAARAAHVHPRGWPPRTSPSAHTWPVRPSRLPPNPRATISGLPCSTSAAAADRRFGGVARRAATARGLARSLEGLAPRRQLAKVERPGAHGAVGAERIGEFALRGHDERVDGPARLEALH